MKSLIYRQLYNTTVFNKKILNKKKPRSPAVTRTKSWLKKNNNERFFVPG